MREKAILVILILLTSSIGTYIYFLNTIDDEEIINNDNEENIFSVNNNISNIPQAAWNYPIGKYLQGGMPHTEPDRLENDGTYNGAPLGGFGSGSIGRSHRGEFSRWHLDVGNHLYNPDVDANQFSVYIDDGDGKKSWVMNPKNPSPLGWNGLPNNPGTYHALYPRAWYEYSFNGMPLELIQEQFSPIIPNNYKETSFPVGVFEWGHIAMTPTWNETAFFADYVLPMGHASERHDINSYATSSGKWVAFRQPVLREYQRRQGHEVEHTYEVNPGEVWEEDEFWNELSHRIDPDGSMGIKKYFMSPYKEDEKMSIDDYYQYIFERVPGLPDAASKENLTELQYMRRHGAYQIEESTYKKYEQEGWPTPSGKQEFYSETMIEFGYPEHAIPHYRIKSHVHPDNLQGENEFCLLPNFRLPMHIHSRSANAKWLVEIANRNPIWIHPSDAQRLGVTEGGLLKIETEIGWFVDKVWVTEAIKPGIVGCSHHIGRWRRKQDAGNRMMTNTVSIEDRGDGKWRMRTVEGIVPFESNDPDTNRLFWRDGGVHQNITHAVQPDPISGAHCWLQKVKITLPSEGEEYGDVEVDTNKSFEYYKKWNSWAKEKEQHPRGERRPLWMKRPLSPNKKYWFIDEEE